jgi:hypothetical protein
MDNNALPPEGTFARLMSMDQQPDKPTGQATREVEKEPSQDRPSESKVPNNEPSKETTNVVSKQSNKQASKVASKQTTKQPFNETGVYAISVPESRRMHRVSFDIFYDQKVALDKLKLAAVDAGELRPKLNAMVQEALDLYIQRRAKQLPQVRLRREAND